MQLLGKLTIHIMADEIKLSFNSLSEKMKRKQCLFLVCRASGVILKGRISRLPEQP